MDAADIFAIVDLHGFEDTEEADKEQLLNDVLQDICTREPWPFLETFVDLNAATSVDAEGAVDMGDLVGFTSLLDINNLSQQGRVINYVRRDQHFRDNSTQLDLTGIPYRYFFVAGVLYLYPVPTSGTFRITYIQEHPAVDVDTTGDEFLLPARHHKILALGMIWRLHAQEDDPENASLFKGQYDEAMMLMRQDLYKLQWDSPDNIRVYDYNEPLDY